MVMAVMVWHSSWAIAAPDDATRAIAVIYPDIGEPYRSVFSTIIDGIEDQTKGRIASYPVSANVNTQELAADLRRRDVRAVIALGRNGLKVASTLDRNLGIVAGGVLSVPESEAQGLSVLSLAPDPALLFAKLKTLMPSARRVVVVYDPRQNAWLIKLAREAAKAQGLELAAYEAEDLKTAVRAYQETLSNAAPKRDVLWLPQDSTTVDEATVLPLVLQEAWNHNLAVFSSSVTHVKRGALFSLYPNNAELGRALAGWALGYLSSGTAFRGVRPLKEVLVAVNTRTANHLGINLNALQQRFDMVFPEP
jgi:putative ABC transport system substrate-binding protein